jgi:hypothetical protein
VDTSIAIFSNHILLAEAIASRLRQHLSSVQFELISPDQPNAVEQIVNINPVAVILDTTDGEIFRHNPIHILLQVLPNVKIICVSLQQEQIQVVSSQMCNAGSVRDLLAFISPANSNNLDDGLDPPIRELQTGNIGYEPS